MGDIMLLEIENLAVEVGGKRVLKDINLSIDEGETHVLLGPNGAGKSTTIKMLTGILYPSNGTISVMGINPSKQRKKLAP